MLLAILKLILECQCLRTEGIDWCSKTHIYMIYQTYLGLFVNLL